MMVKIQGLSLGEEVKRRILDRNIARSPGTGE